MAEEAMLNYTWPGNLRELENLIHSLVVSCDNDMVQLADLPCHMLETTKSYGASGVEFKDVKGQSFKEIIRQFEVYILKEAVSVHGSISEAAKALGVNRSTIFRKLQKTESV